MNSIIVYESCRVIVSSSAEFFPNKGTENAVNRFRWMKSDENRDNAANRFRWMKNNENEESRDNAVNRFRWMQDNENEERR